MHSEKDTVFRLRFDRSGDSPERTEYVYKDFKKVLSAYTISYPVPNGMMTHDPTRTIDVYTFLRRCAAFAEQQCVDADIKDDRTVR